MASSKDGLRALIEQRDALRSELFAIQGKIEGLEIAIRIFQPDPSEERSEKFSLKAFILELLSERKAQGLNASIAVELAGSRGVTVDRASVASLLSRLKSEGTVVHDGNTYRLAQLKELKPSMLSDAAKLDLRRSLDAAARVAVGTIAFT